MNNNELLDIVDDCLRDLAINRKELERADNRELDDITAGLSETYGKLLTVAKELELREKING